MRKLIVLSFAVAFAALLCRVAFCEGEPSEKPLKAEVRKPVPQKEEVRKLMERRREINQELREATAKARRDEGVAKAFEVVRQAEQALAKARENASKAVDAAIIKANPGLQKLVEERRVIEEKLREITRGRFIGERIVPPAGGEKPLAPRPDRPRRPRVRPVAPPPSGEGSSR